MTEESIALEAVNRNLEFAEGEFKNFKENIERCKVVETAKSYKNIFIHLETAADYVFKVPEEKIIELSKKLISFKKSVDNELTTLPSKCKCTPAEPFRYIK